MRAVDASEVVVARLRPHVRSLVGPTIILIGVVGLAAFLVFEVTESWQRLAAIGVATAVIIAAWLVPVLRYFARRSVITTHRVIARHGLVVRVRQELRYSRFSDVTVRQTIGQSLVGSGDVEITAAGDASVVLLDVPSAVLVQAALLDLIEASHRD